jgi:hypothetical protein
MKDKIMAAIQHNKLLFLVLIVVAATIIFTVISVAIYVRLGDISLDLSRPGYEDVRDDVVDDGSYTPYPVDGELGHEALQDFLSRLSKQQTEVGQLTGFIDDVLSDEALDITTDASATP